MLKNKETKLALPDGYKKLLLHSCCAPCACEIMRALKEGEISFAVLFYNPNIDSSDEYLRRKNEVIKYSSKLGVKFYDLDYDSDSWKKRVAKLENEPEKGKRCSVCFDIRMERTALFAHENNFDIFTTSIGISRYKDFNQITSSGKLAASKYGDLIYWDYNWRKNGGSERSASLTKEEGFYRQNYCGCVYSKR